MISKMYRRYRSWRLRAAGARIGAGFQSFDNFFGGIASGFECGPSLYLSSGCKIYVIKHAAKIGRLSIGQNVYVNHYTIIDCHDSISIGNYVLIGPLCYICDYDHGTAQDLLIGSQPPGPTKAVIIGDGVWLGAGVIVLKGVKIGNGAVVGAGSVVTKDVAPFSVVAGNPARFLRNR